MTVTHVDAGTGKVDFDIKPAKAIMVIDKLIKELKSKAQREGIYNGTVDCGSARVRVVDVGDSIECRVSQGKNWAVIRAVIKDVEGRVEFELVNMS